MGLPLFPGETDGTAGGCKPGAPRRQRADAIFWAGAGAGYPTQVRAWQQEHQTGGQLQPTTSACASRDGSRPHGPEDYRWGGGLESRWGIALIRHACRSRCNSLLHFSGRCRKYQGLPASIAVFDGHVQGRYNFLLVVSGAWHLRAGKVASPTFRAEICYDGFSGRASR